MEEKKIKALGMVLFVLAGLSFLIEGNIKDLRDDKIYLVIFQSKGEPRAGVIFNAETGKAEPINALLLPSVFEKSFFEEVKKYNADRVMVLSSESLKHLSKKPYIGFGDSQVLAENAISWMSGYSYVPSPMLKEEKEVWKINSMLLASWVEENGTDMILKREYGAVLDEYRQGSVIIYPENTALKILNLFALEKAF